MSSALSLPNHTFTGQPSKRLTSTVHIISPETDNCLSWISGREKMTVENISWSNHREKMLPNRRGSNPQPPDHQTDAHPTEPPRPLMRPPRCGRGSCLLCLSFVCKVCDVRPSSLCHWLCSVHYENLPIQITENFTTKKMKLSDKKFWYFSYFCSKHRLWDEAVLTSTHNLCLSRNKKNNVYPCKPQFYYIKVGFKRVGGGGQNYTGMFSWWSVALPGRLLY